MYQRLRRVLTRHRHAPARIDSLERSIQVISDQLASLEHQLREQVEVRVPSLFLTAESMLDARLRAFVTSSAEASIAASRTHAEEGLKNVERKAIGVARQHTEAAAAAALERAIEVAHAHAEAASTAALEAAREHAQELYSHGRRDLDHEVSILRRESTAVRRSQREVAPAASNAAPDPAVAAPSPTLPAIDDAFYVALEDRFRGDPAIIAERQRVYLPLVEHLADADYPVLDLGCGRGEWLQVLSTQRIRSVGVDSNPAFAAEVLDAGSIVIQGDLVEHLRSADDASAGAITMFQVVEHLPLPLLIDVMAECVRVLRPGGVFIAETPNSLNLRVAASTFWLDPTHERPLHPELLQFIAQQVGFAKVDGWFLNELAPAAIEVEDPNLRRLIEMVDGPGDYALIAWT